MTPEAAGVPPRGQRQAPRTHRTRARRRQESGGKSRQTDNITPAPPKRAGTGQAHWRVRRLQCEGAMDTPKTSRREFCAHAITFATVASLIEGCGGGSPTSPGGGGGNVPQLSTVSGT